MRKGDLVLLRQADVYRKGRTDPLSIPVWRYGEGGQPTPYSEIKEGQLATVLDWHPAGSPYPHKTRAVRDVGAVEVMLPGQTAPRRRNQRPRLHSAASSSRMSPSGPSTCPIRSISVPLLTGRGGVFPASRFR